MAVMDVKRNSMDLLTGLICEDKAIDVHIWAMGSYLCIYVLL